VVQIGDRRALPLIQDATEVYPRMTSQHYLPPSFTLEWDMYMPKDSFALVLFLDSDANKISFDPGHIEYDGTDNEIHTSYEIPETQANENFTEKWAPRRRFGRSEADEGIPR
jgi:hypothetical protein